MRFFTIECLEIPLASKPLASLTHFLKVASSYCDHSSCDQFFRNWTILDSKYCNGNFVFHIDRLSLLTKKTQTKSNADTIG